jgi:S1-C subfamily serine protease
LIKVKIVTLILLLTLVNWLVMRKKSWKSWGRQLRNYAIAIAVSSLLTLSLGRVSPSQASPVPTTAVPPAPNLIAQQVDPPVFRRSFVTAAVDRVGQAVVRIDTERTITRRMNPLFEDPFFRGFFGDNAFPQAPEERQLRGQGSGFIIDGSGILLTNAHVVNQADRVTVILKDGRSFEGTVQGSDPVTDLAVVKINGRNLPAAPLGDSETVKVGDWAIAVGNPLGLDNTVTLGIVSTLNRSSAQVGIPDKRLDFIQTDAAINPGNSGGPLLNDAGEVIGINTAIRADAMGIGFAIPINKAKAIYPQLAKGQKVPHPYLGIRMATLTPRVAKENNSDPNSPMQLPEIEGVLVVQVLPNTPAEAGGLRSGDVITAIESQPIVSAEQLQRLVERSQVGQTLRIRVQRGSSTQVLSIPTGQLEEFS